MPDKLYVDACGGCPSRHAGHGEIPLSAVPAGGAAVLRCVYGGCGMAARLAAMGFLPGMPVEVCRNDSHGPILVRVKGSRVMLGRGMAEKLSVRCFQKSAFES